MLSTFLQHLTQNNSNNIPLFWDSSKFQNQTVSENSRVIKTILSMFMCTQNKSICVESIKGPVSSFSWGGCSLTSANCTLPYFPNGVCQKRTFEDENGLLKCVSYLKMMKPDILFLQVLHTGHLKFWNQFHGLYCSFQYPHTLSPII